MHTEKTKNSYITNSPLRYPGGKAGLFKFIAEVIRLNDCLNGTYYEPFAGGAGCALRLLSARVVSKIVLNDADPCLYAFWRAALTETDRFIEKIYNTPLTTTSWKECKRVWQNQANENQFDVGFATFFLNRCNRSGIIANSGPIGGHEQVGKWKIDARFNPKTLADRIQFIGNNKRQIEVQNLDVMVFLNKNFTSRKNHGRFVYLDPPYYIAGKRLYFNSFTDEKHIELSNFMSRQKKLKWIITYDDNQFIKKLYNKFRLYYYYLYYSLQNKQKTRELIAVPVNMEIPPTFSFDSKRIEPISIQYNTN